MHPYLQVRVYQFSESKCSNEGILVVLSELQSQMLERQKLDKKNRYIFTSLKIVKSCMAAVCF